MVTEINFKWFGCDHSSYAGKWPMNFVFFFFLCWGVGHTGIVLRLLFYCLWICICMPTSLLLLNTVKKISTLFISCMKAMNSCSMNIFTPEPLWDLWCRYFARGRTFPSLLPSEEMWFCFCNFCPGILKSHPLMNWPAKIKYHL